MRRLAILATATSLGLGLALPGSAQDRPPGGMSARSLGSYANPSAIIAAEIEFAHLAREKGEDAAIRATAADSAIVFAPARTLVRDSLKQRSAAVTPAALQTAEVWSSCDGSYAIARGTWRRGAAGGTFVTLWQRQPKRGYKWLLDLKSTTHLPGQPAPDALDMIAGNVAPCSGPGDRGGPPRGKKPRIMQPGIDPANGASDDGSLRWSVTIDAAGTGQFVASTAGPRGTSSVGGREVMRVPLALQAGPQR